MKSDILSWIRKVCNYYGIQAYFHPKRSVYILHYRGRAIQNFTEDQFYQIPKELRFKMILPLIKVGLHNNLSNPQKDSLFNRYNHGINIC